MKTSLGLIASFCITLAAASIPAQAEEAGCLTVNGNKFCCKQTITAKYNGSYFTGEINQIYSDGNAEISWDGTPAQIEKLASIPIVRKLKCSSGYCTGDQFTARYNGEYLNGTVGVIYDDGMGVVSWNGVPGNFELLSSIPRVRVVKCHSGYCSGESFTANYGGNYYRGTVGVIYDDGVGVVSWNGTPGQNEVLSSIPRVRKICPQDGKCQSLAAQDDDDVIKQVNEVPAPGADTTNKYTPIQITF